MHRHCFLLCLLLGLLLSGLTAACRSAGPLPETAEVIYLGRPEEG